MHTLPTSTATLVVLALLVAVTPASARELAEPSADLDAARASPADEPPHDDAFPTDSRPITGPDAIVPNDDETRAITLYFAGEGAYNLGDFTLAIDNFERAYALSSKPDLLYNVSLAYYRRHETSQELSDLQRARVVLVNFELALGKDPSIGDPHQVQALMGQIDAALASARRPTSSASSPPAASALPVEGPAPATCPDVPLGDDPGKSTRIGGAVAIGVGGLLIAGGAASIAAFVYKGQEFENTLASLQQDQAAAGCDANSTSEQCQLLQQSIDTTINNGRQANILAATLGTSLTVFGTAALVTGAVLFAQGSRRSKAWEQRREISVAPSLGGLIVHGRF